MNTNKIALGTVQFGLDYGINNYRGKIPKTEVFDILKYAKENGIEVLDTAAAYGNSESVIGDYGEQFKIVTKVSKNESPISSLNNSLTKLKQKKVYALLLHDFSSYNEKIWREMQELKKNGLVEKIGFSLYHINELDLIINLDFDIVQIPYNIFDQRFSKYFSKLKENDVEIHVRSIFLQGLFFKNIEDLSGKLKHENLVNLKKISQDKNIPINALCICFVYLNSYIDKIIIGVDSINNLEQNISALNYLEYVVKIFKELEQLRIEDEQIILPVNW